VKEPYNKLKKFVTHDMWKQVLHTSKRKDDTIAINIDAFVRQAVKNVLIIYLRQ
jgi:hypothetical protein